jgi:hypothetical protein
MASSTYGLDTLRGPLGRRHPDDRLSAHARSRRSDAAPLERRTLISRINPRLQPCAAKRKRMGEGGR